MPFGIKNAGATYQMMMTRMFRDKIGHTVEVYTDDMVVKKKNSKWKVYVDFMDLNRACPKDPFPMPKIDQLIYAMNGHSRMSFLDAF